MSQETNKRDDISLEILASDLAFNMIDNATHGYNPNEYNRAFSLLLEEDLVKNYPNRYEWDRRVRNVLIIGAGASKDACADVLLSTGLVTGLKEIISHSSMPEDKKNYFCNILSLDDEFARAMQVYVETIDDLELRDKIREIFNYKYETSLFYEIVAHMFKHKLIDVIINYNFDEILDNVLEDEMGKTQYRKVFFNGDVPSYDSLLFDKRFKVDERSKLATPLYIKPHGTVSYPETFQYTNAHYHRNGYNNINKLIKDVLNGRYETTAGEKRKIRINILAAGYAYKDIDLASILYTVVDENIDRPINFFTFDWNTEPDFIKNSEFFKTITAFGIKKEVQFKHIWVNNKEAETTEDSTSLPDEYSNLGKAFERLWDSICSKFINKEMPRDIIRHKFISTLFGGRRIKDIEAYFECRIYVELAILMSKTDGGILHMSQIEESRVRKYFNLYYKDKNKYNNKKSLRQFIHGFKTLKILKQYMGFSDTYELCKKEGDKTEIFDKCFKLIEKNLPYMVGSDIEKVRETSRKQFNDMSNRKLLYIVNSDITQYNISPFEGLEMENYLYSDMRWHLKSRELLARSDWNVMLNISERGSLVEYFKNWPTDKKVAIYTITADYDQPRINSTKDALIKEAYANIYQKRLTLPWEIHNKHMSIFLNVNEDYTEFIGGIYYTRRLLTNIVNPIYVGDVAPEDIVESNSEDNKGNGNILFDFFCNYWLNARIYDGEKIKKNDDVDSPIVTSLKIEESDYKRNKTELIKTIKKSLSLGV